MLSIDINSDLGESFGHYSIGNDEAVINCVTSVNIACGFHAGDPLVMAKTVERAIANHTAIGAHPGFPDLMGFGRRELRISPAETKAYVIYQVSALMGFVRANGASMQHVKPHGALYNMAVNDYSIAKAIAEAVYEVDRDLLLMGLSGSELIKAGKDTGLKTASEVFADRTYTNEGKLVNRSNANAIIHDKESAAAQILSMVLENKVIAEDGTEVAIEADTICVHGDNEKALELIHYIKDKLVRNNINITSLRP